jgi:repressor of nif and glnA expression
MMDNIFRPHQRIIMLQAIERDAGRSLSNEMLQRLLREHGQNCGIAEINEQINWLENRGYIKTKRLGNTALVIVEILRPGIEAATGLIRAEGIDPPPEE